MMLYLWFLIIFPPIPAFTLLLLTKATLKCMFVNWSNWTNILCSIPRLIFFFFLSLGTIWVLFKIYVQFSYIFWFWSALTTLKTLQTYPWKSENFTKIRMYPQSKQIIIVWITFMMWNFTFLRLKVVLLTCVW